MSSEATGWVYRYSTATGSVFQVHHAVADSVNDQHSNEFWMMMANLAVKARCTRGTAAKAMTWLEEHGFIELLSERSGGRSQSARYRFLFPAVDVVYDSRKVRADRAVTKSDTARSGNESARSTASKVRADRARKEPKGKTQENPSTRAAPLFTDDNGATVNGSLEKDPNYGFEKFWTAYPARGGRKLNKAKAVPVWRKLSYDEKRDAWLGAKNLATAVEADGRWAPDAFRWLRDRAWDGWLEDVEPEVKRPPKPNPDAVWSDYSNAWVS